MNWLRKHFSRMWMYRYGYGAKLSSDEVAILKHDIECRLRDEDYTCRLPRPFPVPKLRTYHAQPRDWRGSRPVYRYKLRTVVLGGLTNRQVVWK